MQRTTKYADVTIYTDVSLSDDMGGGSEIMIAVTRRIDPKTYSASTIVKAA